MGLSGGRHLRAAGFEGTWRPWRTVASRAAARDRATARPQRRFEREWRAAGVLSLGGYGPFPARPGCPDRRIGAYRLRAPQQAAIDRDVGTGDEIRRRAGKECCDAGEIVRCAKPAGCRTGKGSFVEAPMLFDEQKNSAHRWAEELANGRS